MILTRDQFVARAAIAIAAIGLSTTFAGAQTPAPQDPASPAPVILFTVSPAAVEYQLRRLTPNELVRVERTPTDPKYRPVYRALLSRQGVPGTVREEALGVLAATPQATRAMVLLTRLAEAEDDLTIGWLVTRLLAEPPGQLAAERAAISREIDLAQTSGSLLHRGAYPALMLGGDAPAVVWQRAETKAGHLAELLRGLAYLPANAAGDRIRAALVAPVESVLDTTRDAILRAAAADALAWIRPDAATYARLANEIVPTADPQVVSAAIRALARLPAQIRPAGPALETLARAVVAVIQTTPAARRTQPATTDAIHFAESLTATLPEPSRLALRRDLRALGVQVVRIGTIVEQMLYDVRWFVVEAGRPVQVVFTNVEAMPHNVVIGRPGSLVEIATLGAAVPLPADPAAKAYVPNSPLVLWSTRLLKEGETERLNFTAPAAPGEYVFVCTFPGHATRMYGVMLVVADRDAWDAKPVVPIDPMTKSPFTSDRH